MAAAIMEKAPASDYRIVKVFETRLSTTSQHLVHAVRACVSEGVRLINLSLAGTDADTRGLWEEVVAEAGVAGSIIVSACDRRREDLLPGSLAATIGVIVDPKCPREEFRLSAGEAPTIGASGYPRHVEMAWCHHRVSDVRGGLEERLRRDLGIAVHVLSLNGAPKSKRYDSGCGRNRTKRCVHDSSAIESDRLSLNTQIE